MVEYSDSHHVTVPSSWNAIDFAQQVLGNAPTWLIRLLEIRDRIVAKLGFATQPGRSHTADITVGGTAGPFVFSEVTPSVVRGGNSDKRMVFGSTFRVAQRAGRAYGILETRTRSRDTLGAIYLTIIWPAHKLVMKRILRSGMSGVGV